MDSITPQPIAHLLVTLDGSRLAESTIHPAITLAKHLGGHVTLLHILERDAPETIHGQRHLTNIGEAEAYLTGLASRFADAGIPVETHVHPNPEGDVAASIAVHAFGHRADLIIMCAHGRGGWRDWLLGGIAQRTVRRAGAPILMIRQETSDRVATFEPHAVTVALDGTAEGERALPPALTLATALGVSLHLLLVVATLTTVGGDRAATARLMPTATSAALDQESSSAREYLGQLRERLSRAGIPITIEVQRGAAKQAVLASASQHGENLVALVTHGRAGLEAIWSASVGAQVISRSNGPLLLVSARSHGQPTDD